MLKALIDFQIGTVTCLGGDLFEGGLIKNMQFFSRGLIKNLQFYSRGAY